MKKSPVAAALCALLVCAGAQAATPPKSTKSTAHNIGPHGWPDTWPDVTQKVRVGNATCVLQGWNLDRYGSYVVRVVCPKPQARGVAMVWSVDGSLGKRRR